MDKTAFRSRMTHKMGHASEHVLKGTLTSKFSKFSDYNKYLSHTRFRQWPVFHHNPKNLIAGYTSIKWLLNDCTFGSEDRM